MLEYNYILVLFQHVRPSTTMYKFDPLHVRGCIPDGSPQMFARAITSLTFEISNTCNHIHIYHLMIRIHVTNYAQIIFIRKEKYIVPK